MFFNSKKKKLLKTGNDAIQASLFGFFIGDALGVPVEFQSREKLERKKVTKMKGYGTHNQPKGTWSDDSSMVLATIDGLIQSNGYNINYQAIMSNFLKWKSRGEFMPFNYVFDIGNATNNALIVYQQKVAENKVDDVICGNDNIYSNGNGSLMRILPVSLYLHYLKIDYKEPKYLDIIRTISGMTHAHIYSVFACYMYSIYISEIIEYKDKKIAYDNLQTIVKGIIETHSKFNEIKNVYSRIIYQDISKLRREEIKSSGYVVDSIEATMWSVLNSKSFSDAVLKAVNLGDDTDTIGALTGALAGIIYGYDNIPSRWIKALQRKDYLQENVNKFEKKLEEEKKKAFIDIIADFMKAMKNGEEVCKLTPGAYLENGTPFTSETEWGEKIGKFVNSLAENNMMDFDYITNIDKIKNKEIEEFTLPEVLTYITFLIRRDRFCSGALYGSVQDGTLLRATERLYNLEK